ncbi:MAG: hypothetical protein AAFY71_18450 [Bacteroidota bacterium]
MNVKNAIATGLVVFGLILAITGFNKKAGETVDYDYDGTEQVLRNSESQHFNWRAFLGFAVSGIGFLLYAFPSQKDIEARRYGQA